MKPSSSKYISMESMPLTELFDGEPGATGLYIPAPDTAAVFGTALPGSRQPLNVTARSAESAPPYKPWLFFAMKATAIFR